MFYAESYQTELDNNQEMVIPRSVAASYLFGLPPIRRYQDQLSNSPIDSSSLLISTNKNNPQQRTKRIYWENLAFHAADFNQKAKKL